MELSPLSNLIPSWDSPTLQGFDLNNVQDGERIKGSGRQFVRFYPKKFVEVYATEVKINPKTGDTRVLKSGTREVEKEMVEIVTPGDKNIINDVATDWHRREFWSQYKAFRDGNSAPIGTNLDDVEFVSPNIATELRYLKCHTLEQLADASDQLCNLVADGFQLREFARARVKAELDNKSMGQVSTLKSALEQTQAELEALKQQLKGGIPLEPMPVEATRGRGRPRKEIAE